MVLTRYKQPGTVEDLEELITYHCETLALHRYGHPDHSSSLNNLANAVLTRYKQSGGMEDLEEVITYYHEVGHTTSADCPRVGTDNPSFPWIKPDLGDDSKIL